MNKKKVMLGMSGGVDSSVAAYLLLEQGYEVIGVTLQVWSDKTKDSSNGDTTCCSLFAVNDARRVADKLGIAYYVLNFKDDFKTYVIDYFNNEYLLGRTPNPCIACNKHIKFKILLDKAKALGMDYIATGHYAKVEVLQNKYILKKGLDEKKDQTYVLYNLTQDQLSKVLMPLGEYRKDEIREIAKNLGLLVADKKDSQEICFVEDKTYAKFILENTDADIKEGDFVDTNGRKLGTHKGIIHYTKGQRKGLGIAFGKPKYVIGINSNENKVILGDYEELFSDTFYAKNVNFISINLVDKPIRVKAKIRYKAPEVDAIIFPYDDEKIKVVFDTPQRAITPGQAVVFYDQDRVVGGGIID